MTDLEVLLREAARSALTFIENLRVPQTKEHAAWQVVQGGRVLEQLRTALSSHPSPIASRGGEEAVAWRRRVREHRAAPWHFSEYKPNVREDYYEVEPLYASPRGAQGDHPDDVAVDKFAAAMKAKLAKKRAEGRGGWDDPAQCSVPYLAQLLVEHCGKVNSAVDIANFAMMVWHRTNSHDTTFIPEANLAERLKWLEGRASPAAPDAKDAARWRALLNCQRIRVLGWAGIAMDGKTLTRDGYVHVGFEFTTHHDAPSDPLATTLLTTLADTAMALLTNIKEKPT